MIDMVIFMRRFCNGLLDGLECWMNDGMANIMICQAMTAVTDWCGDIFRAFAACVYIRLLLETIVVTSDRLSIFHLPRVGPSGTTDLHLQLLRHLQILSTPRHVRYSGFAHCDL